MKLRNWKIDGFGVFCGAVLPGDGLRDGLNLFIGPNEAGKSTLLDFLRYTLFGYPSGRTRLPRHEPLHGGIHGGTLIYDTDGLTIQVHRSSEKKNPIQLYDQNDNVLTEDDLTRHLGHVSAGVFRSIFGFSLRELQELDSLTQDDVRELIFAASIGQSTGRIREVENSLSKQADTIFREGARATGEKAPRLVNLHQELNQLEEQLAHAMKASHAIAEKVKELESKRVRRKELDNRLQVLGRDTQHISRLISGWVIWVERCQLDSERQELGEVSHFPIGGDVELATRKTEFDQARRQAEIRCGEARIVKGKLSKLPTEFPVLLISNIVEGLAARRSDYDVSQQLAINALEKAAEAQQSWMLKSEVLGSDWPEEVVRNFDVSLFSEDDARRLAKQVRDSELASSNKRTVAVSLARELRTASTDCFAKADQLEQVMSTGLLLQSEEIAGERVRLGEFREASRKRETFQDDLARAQDHLAQVKLYTSSREPAQQRAKTWLPGALVIGALAFAAGAMALFYIEQLFAGGLSAAFSVVLLCIAFILRSQVTREPPLVVASSELIEAQDRFATATKVLKEHDDFWRQEAIRANLSWPAGENELIAWEGRISSEERRLNEANHVSSALAELRSKRKTKAIAFRIAMRELDEAEQNYSGSLHEWTKFLLDRRLPETIQVETAVGVFSTVKGARQNLKDFDDCEFASKQREGESQTYIQEIQTCLQQAKAPVDESPEKTLALFDELRQDVSEKSQQSRDRQVLVLDWQSARKSLRDSVKLARDARARLKVLLRQSGVHDEPSFMALSERVKRHQELTHVISQNDTALVTIFGRAGIPSELREAWDSETRPDWESEMLQYESETRDLTNERDTSIQEHTTLEIEIGSQMRSDEIAQLQLEAEAVREDIRKGLMEWMDLATALELLRRTREKFELENQSPALEEASRLFQLISGERYERVFIPLDPTGGELTIVQRVGPNLALESLSRGTLEQLYLCIRLGYVRHYQRQQRINLPLLMDDIAVNFDPERIARTFDVLKEYSQAGQQILFLSCHEELLKLLGPEDKVFRIRDFEFESMPIHQSAPVSSE